MLYAFMYSLHIYIYTSFVMKYEIMRIASHRDLLQINK